MTRRQVLLMGAILTAGGAHGETRPNWDREWKVAEGPTGKEIRARDLPGRLSSANIIFAGEQHDDPETHRAELAMLVMLHRKFGERLTLAMEMFERDNQAALTDFVTGKTEESAFSGSARFWKNYPTDYRPLIVYARENRVPVVASNAPQPFVRKVGKEGIASLAGLSTGEKAQIAAYVNAPEGDEYARRFAAVIGEGHGDGGGMDAAMVRRFYEAQCLRDDTMAESIVREIDGGRVVLHINGSFHSDAGLGTAARTLWRRPLTARIAVIKIVPRKPGAVEENLRGEADYLIYVPDKRSSPPKV